MQASADQGDESDDYEEYMEEVEVDESSRSNDDEHTVPDIASFPTSSYSNDEWMTRKRLVRFFMYYEPSQLKVVDQWLANWRGREELLFRELVAYHGPEPNAGSLPGNRIVVSAKQRLLDECLILLRQFFAFYAPERYQDAEDVLLAWTEREEQLRQHLQDQQALRDFVMKHFAVNFPDRVAEVPVLLRQWLGHEGELIDHLARNGADPVPRDPTEMSSADIPIFGDARAKLVQFFRVFDPDKVSEVDTILQFYKGREEVLFRSLRRKHMRVIDETPEGKRDRTRDGVWLKLCKAWNPDALPQVEHLVMTHSGTEKEFLRDFSQVCFGALLQLDAADSQPAARETRQLAKPSKANVEVQTATWFEGELQSSQLIVERSALAVKAAAQRDGFVAVSTAAFDMPCGAALNEYAALSHFLHQNDLSAAYQVLVDNEVSLEVLAHVSRADLEDIGVDTVMAARLEACAKKLATSA